MTVYSNEFGTEIDVSDELVGFLDGTWRRRRAVETPRASSPTPAAPPATSTESAPPPKGGKGSSDAAWTTYARANGIDVTDEMSRKDVIAACESAGVPTE